MLWGFTPEQLQDPDKVVEYLKGKCCGYSKETQLTALCWALAMISQTLLDSRQHHPERESGPTGTAATQTPATGTVAEPKDQPIPVSVAPTHKKKYTRKSVRLVKDDDEPGPSREQEEEPEPEIITRSLSLSELQDMRKDFSRLPGEHIITWLLRCWDNRASSLELEGREAKQLGSPSREGGIDKAIGKKAQALSLWRRLLSSVRERYPFSEDVVCRPGKWTTMEQGTQYLRELAVREMVYYDPDNAQLPTDPDEVQCTRPMWRKFVRSAPSSYANSLAVIDWKSEEAPTVDEVAGRLRQYEENLSSSLVSAVEKLSQDVRQLKEDMSYSPPVQTRIAAVRRGSQQLTLLEAEVSLTGNEWQKHPIVTGPKAPCILGIDHLRRGYFKDPKGYRWAFGIAALETGEIEPLSSLPGLSEDPSVVGLLRVEEQQVPIATTTVHRRQYRTNRDSLVPIHKLIHQLEGQGVISRTRSPFNSPIWPVWKSNGEWRLTVDYRGLNEVTPPMSAAMPDMLELHYELESKAAKWYATIDRANAFFSIPLVTECRPQFAFTWRGVQYTWNRLPQGWKHSPTICHGLIQTALGEKGEAPEHLQYIADIIVWGNSAEEASEKGKKIIQILLQAGFAIKRSKVKGPVQEIQFLGIRWHDGCHQIPMDIFNKIAAMSPPTNKKETQAFLGVVGFWRMHIPNYSLIVSPLYHVTQKKNDFKWGPEQRQAFEQIKQEIVHAIALGPVRAGPDVKNVLYTAAGENGPTWSLWQKAPGETRGQPLGFWSRGYRGSEVPYTPTEKEILAAYEGIRAASEVIGTEAQLLLAPRLPGLGWMFKERAPSTHHATNATWKEEVTHAEEAPPYNKLTEDEKPYALFTDGSCCIVGKHRRWKAAVWSPTRRVAEAAEGEGEWSQFAEVKAIQLALDIAEREKWLMLYLCTDSWMVANALWGWLQQWKQSNWQRRGKPIWAAELWQDIAARLEKLVVKVRHVDAHIPKRWATEEHQNNQQVDQAAKIEVAQVDLDWQHKGELFIARWAHDPSGHQGRDATYRWARDRGVDLTMDAISQVIHQCETCAAIKQAKRVKPLWYGGRWLKYKYGEAWQIDYITLPQSRQGKRYVLTMVEATTGWLETYSIPHATSRNAILGLENGLLKTTLRAMGGGTLKHWDTHLAKATWQHLALGVLAQQLGSWKRPVGYFSKQLDNVVLLEQDDVELKTTAIVNPAMFLSTENPTEKLEHDRLLTIEQVYSSRPDLKDEPLKDPDLELFTDGSSFVQEGRRMAGYAVVTTDKVLESGTLPANTSAQKAELVALKQALRMAEGKRVNIQTDSKYAFGVIHAHGAIWKERGLLSAQGSPIRHKEEVLQLLQDVQKPKEVAVMHCKAHQFGQTVIDWRIKLQKRLQNKVSLH
ncbi:hypothetical protein GRJ2_003129000 [Grus japonensis]|uniref:ribonuclease H n=1 Tax=Grus japonensis TaxID=30415 RepID=A0ABC9YAX5_GRUJA